MKYSPLRPRGDVRGRVHPYEHLHLAAVLGGPRDAAAAERVVPDVLQQAVPAEAQVLVDPPVGLPLSLHVGVDDRGVGPGVLEDAVPLSVGLLDGHVGLGLGDHHHRLELDDLGVPRLLHPSDVLLAGRSHQDGIRERPRQVVLVDLQRVDGRVQPRLEDPVELGPHDLGDLLLLVEELVGGEPRGQLRDDVYANELRYVHVVADLVVVLVVQLVEAVRHEAVLEGDAEDQRQAVLGPAVEEVPVLVVVLHGLDRLRVPQQLAEGPDELQARLDDDLLAHGAQHVVVPERHLRRRQARPGEQEEQGREAAAAAAAELERLPGHGGRDAAPAPGQRALRLLPASRQREPQSRDMGRDAS
mmetsp:Transcript_24072/g.71646  ORF Transcript_24072/g.71646 Transcript_24072/m.71646 type:complete len:358 (+) Transcript_24072:1-1074(+)